MPDCCSVAPSFPFRGPCGRDARGPSGATSWRQLVQGNESLGRGLRGRAAAAAAAAAGLVAVEDLRPEQPQEGGRDNGESGDLLPVHTQTPHPRVRLTW